MRARFYNPVIGRFTQEDTYRGDGLNLYAYCGNNPVGYYDPSGYSSLKKERPLELNKPLFEIPEGGVCGGNNGNMLNGLPKSQRLLDAEAKLAEAAKGDINPTIDNNTGWEVGKIYVDPNGNAMISPKGGGFNSGGYRGLDTQTTYPNGSSYQRNNPNGHASSSGQNHGHGHLPGTGLGRNGTGPSIDVNGNVVPYNSTGAHWPIKP